MAKTQISIKLEEDTLRRMNEAAELLTTTRTAFIQRACVRAMESLDAIISEMRGDLKVTTATLDAHRTVPEAHMRRSLNDDLCHRMTRTGPMISRHKCL